MNIRPLYDRIVVERIIAETKTKSGIFLPEESNSSYQTARVIAVGEGKLLPSGQLRGTSIKPGEIVLLGKYNGIEAGKDLLIIREDEVLGIVS